MLYRAVLTLPRRSGIGLSRTRIIARCWYSSRAAPTEEFPNAEFFNYNSARWIHHERAQLAKRYHFFNVDALKSVAVQATGANSVTGMRKVFEDDFNKEFALSLDNGKEVVARLPTSLAGPGYLVTASEVATMDFVRSRLDIPVPKVLAWSSNDDDSRPQPVESDYIIMEKPTGVALLEAWQSMSSDLKRTFVEEFIRMEAKYLKSLSGGYGALYKRGDMDDSVTCDLLVNGVRDETFVLGPATSTSWWAEEKAEMDSIHRGPWQSPIDLILATAHREKEFISEHGFEPAIGPFDPPTSKQTVAAYVALIDRLIEVAPYLIPPSVEQTQPTVVHRHLSSRNIFVCPDELAQGRIKITSVTDWKHTTVLPLYMAARTAPFLEYMDSTKPSQDPLEHLPPEETLDEDGKKLVQSLRDTRDLHLFYLQQTANANPAYGDALLDPLRPHYIRPYVYGGEAYPKQFIAFRESLYALVENWESLKTGVPCPISFSEEENKARLVELEEWKAYESNTALTNKVLGVGPEGKTTHEHYERAVELNLLFMGNYVEEMKKEVPEGTKVHELVAHCWPYRTWEDEMPSKHNR